MRVKYFTDTDTALFELSDLIPVATHELNENIYVDLDAYGRVVSITIEHARSSAAMHEFSYHIISAENEKIAAKAFC